MSARVNCGSEVLFAKNEWCPAKEIQGTDLDVINHPLMKEAFNRTLEAHEVRHTTALLSLCTKTRPYSKGRKWKTLRNRYGEHADLIVTSNGGIVPLQLEGAYPFKTYDAKGERSNDNAYKVALRQKLSTFFERHRYERLVFLYRPTLRNVDAARHACYALSARGLIKTFAILPSQLLYRSIIGRKVMRNGKSRPAYQCEGYTYYPDIHPLTLAALDGALGVRT